ncbi:hypothetical protein [Alicyclobacillus sp. SO9]|uniref:hypothetical protein n=1 Tax=Alicyclobacillus sp. SO9 TaxID=2665646 RepID=UPI0018E900C8|nr:hypothetical protein [Alicyclobacillus sp. SO9]QQE81619.1 hypothetical protein GI364_24820 [Alicyclobacillus sp. SO9]
MKKFNRGLLASITGLFILPILATTAFASTSQSSTSAKLRAESNVNRQMVLKWAAKNGVLNEFKSSHSVKVNSKNSTLAILPNTAVAGPGGGVTPVAGDILVTNDTSSAGLTGHAGIVVDSQGDVETINGPLDSPIIQSWSSFWSNNNYQVDVVQPNNASEGQNAANWAITWIYENGSSTYYNLTPNLYTTAAGDATYCSKIVFDAYYYGAGITLSHTGSYCLPYDLINMPYMPGFQEVYVGF